MRFEGEAVATGLILLALLGSGAAEAVRSYRFSGTVTLISGASITVSDGRKSVEVDCRRLPKTPEVGDEITVRYELDAVKIEPRYRPEQQPGRVPPRKLPGRGAPGEKKQDILDDRAFYD